MFAKSKLAIIAVVTLLGLVSPALAQNQGRTPPFGSHYGPLQSLPKQTSRLDTNHPAMCGGGNIGYNRNLSFQQ